MIGVLLFVSLLVLIYLKVIKLYSYWANKGVKHRKPIYLLGDSCGPILQRESVYDMFRNVYNDFPEERYFGIYQTTVPALVLRDPDLIKTITIKDFDSFVNHPPVFPEGNQAIWSKNILSLKDQAWKHMRNSLSPSFTSSKLKSIFNLITDCSNTYINYITKSNSSVFELKDLMTRYATDIIGTVAYGITCDSVNERNNEFFVKGAEMTNLSFSKVLKIFAYQSFPTLSTKLNLEVFPEGPTKFFENLIKNNIKLREENEIIRNDMIHLLMQARDKQLAEENKTNLTDDNIAAQAFIFFFGGAESVSTALCFMGYELAIHQEIQKKLQKEVDETLKECKGNLTYEAVGKMKYLDMVVSETIRKWPSLPFQDRVCTKPYTIEPIRKDEKPVHLKPGDKVLIPHYGLHYDKKYFPKPYEFDPERFNDENKEKIHPGVYTPFGSGPRNCIASRLALLEIKTLFFHILTNFDLVPTEKTEIPLTLSKSKFNLFPQNGIWVEMKPRTVKK